MIYTHKLVIIPSYYSVHNYALISHPLFHNVSSNKTIFACLKTTIFMKVSFCIFLALFMLFGKVSLAQDTLTLLDGKTIFGEVIDADSSYITYKFLKKNKIKERLLNTDIIFSVSYQSGKTDTIYYQNPEIENYLTVKEMHYFIMGEQDARKHYKATLTSVLGLAFGGALGYALPDGIWIAAVPLVYTVGASLTEIKIIYKDNRSQEIMRSPAYQEGYIKVARSKKAFNALASSLAGTIIGAGTRYVTD